MKLWGTQYLGLVGVIGVLGILTLLYFFVGLDTLKEAVVSAGVFAPILFILLKASTIIVIPLSGSPLYPLAGLFFGFGHGITYALIGDFLGFTVSFWLARTFGYPVVNTFIVANDKSLVTRIISHVGTVKGLFHTYLAFFGMPELISYAAGLSRLSYIKFIAVLFPLSAVGSVILVLLGVVFSESEQLEYIFIPTLVGIVFFTLGIYFFGRAVLKNQRAD